MFHRRRIKERTITIKGHKVLVTHVHGNKSLVQQVRRELKTWARELLEHRAHFS